MNKPVKVIQLKQEDTRSTASELNAIAGQSSCTMHPCFNFPINRSCFAILAKGLKIEVVIWIGKHIHPSISVPNPVHLIPAAVGWEARHTLVRLPFCLRDIVEASEAKFCAGLYIFEFFLRKKKSRYLWHVFTFSQWSWF